MSLVKYIDVFFTSTHLISLLGSLRNFISLNICSRNFGDMNLYQLGVFGYKQQKPTLANLNKEGDLGKDMEERKVQAQRTKFRLAGEPSLAPEQTSRSYGVKNIWLFFLGAVAGQI